MSWRGWKNEDDILLTFLFWIQSGWSMLMTPRMRLCQAVLVRVSIVR